MNSKEIIEGNKLIAKFLGWKTFSRYHSWRCKNVIQYEQSLLDEPYISENDGYLYEGSELFHSSWDWLMPVVEKIEKLDDYSVEISYCRCRIFDTRNLSIAFNSDSKILATWFAVVEFIKWYNKQNNK